MLILGLVGAMGLFWYLAKRTRVHDVVFGFYATLGIVSIGMGLFGAWAFQQIYRMVEFFVEYRTLSGFSVAAGGFTFMGGLLLGAFTFVMGTFLFGRKNVKREFWKMLGLAIPCLALALAFGRMGCFFAACCYGVEASWGIQFPPSNANPPRRVPPHPVVPTNLFEAIFSMLLCVGMLFLTLRKKKGNLNVFIYGFAYSIWRFSIEFVRDDDRAAAFILTPSQIQSIVLFVVVLALLLLVHKFKIIPFRLGKALELGDSGQTAEDREGRIVDRPLESADANAEDDFYATAANETVGADTDTTLNSEQEEQEEDSFYTSQQQQENEEERLTVAESKHNGFTSLVKKFFIGGIALGALLAIIGFSLFAVPAPVAISFLLTFSGASLVFAAASMPLPTKDFFKSCGKSHHYYNAGFSIMGMAIGKHKQ